MFHKPNVIQNEDSFLEDKLDGDSEEYVEHIIG